MEEMNSNEIEKLTNLPVSADLATDVRTILQEARKIVARQTNTAMTAAYWLIGKRIVEEEQHGEDRAIYGDALLKNLSKELTAEFGNGFSYTNLKNMRKFYKTYQDEKGQTLSAQLSWSHNCLIMRVQDPKVRVWYNFASKYLPYLPTEEELRRELESSGCDEIENE